MKSYKLLILSGLALLCLASCTKKAVVSGILEGASGSNVVVKVLDVNVQKTVDTLKTGADGSFRYSMEVKQGEPRFVYLYHNGTKVSSLLLSCGERVKVAADTLGNYSVSGSDESVKLLEVEKDYSAFIADLENTIAEAEGTQAELNKAVSKKYIDYHRKALQYIVANPKSLTVIPVLYQKINNNFPVFNRLEDAIYFQSAADSLKTVYPESEYVKALEREATRRGNMLALDRRMQEASPLGFPDLEMPDINGEKVKLSDVDAKVIMIMFWSAADAAQKMLNIDQLLPLYKEFHPKGFEIYSVNADVDKALWATTIRKQGADWINVCDGLGASSPAIMKYNVSSLPTFFLIRNGEFWNEPVGGTDALRAFLRKNL